MNSISEQLNELKSKIIELENEQLFINEMNNKKSTSHNFTILNDFLIEKKTAIKNNNYSKSIPLAQYYDIQRVKYVEAIVNLLEIMDERLTKLENKN